MPLSATDRLLLLCRPDEPANGSTNGLASELPEPRVSFNAFIDVDVDGAIPKCTKSDVRKPDDDPRDAANAVAAIVAVMGKPADDDGCEVDWILSLFNDARRAGPCDPDCRRDIIACRIENWLNEIDWEDANVRLFDTNMIFYFNSVIISVGRPAISRLIHVTIVQAARAVTFSILMNDTNSYLK